MNHDFGKLDLIFASFKFRTAIHFEVFLHTRGAQQNLYIGINWGLKYIYIYSIFTIVYPILIHCNHCIGLEQPIDLH